MNLLSFFNTQVSDKVGTAPGTMAYIGEPRKRPPVVSVFRYHADGLEENPEVALADLTLPENTPGVTWINLDGIHEVELITGLGNKFGLHPLTMEDIVNTTQRPKMEEYDNGLYLVLKMIAFEEETAELDIEQVSFFLGKGFVLTFQEKSQDVLEPVRKRLRQGTTRIRKRGEDYLFYALIDVVVSHYYLVLEEIENRIDELDESIHEKNSSQTIAEIQKLKKNLIVLRKSIHPLLEVVNQLLKPQEQIVMDKKTLPYFRDLYGHLKQILELVETYREVLSGLYDLHFALNGQKLNEIMKVLTVVSTIFIPLTFIAGIYGMNFQNMPELTWSYGYFAAWGLMVLIAVVLLILFRRKSWL
jgi:magnesium transporter